MPSPSSKEKEIEFEVNARQAGRFTRAMSQLSGWIFKRQTFVYQAPDYVVVGMTRKTFEEKFGDKSKEKAPLLIFDELENV